MPPAVAVVRSNRQTVEEANRQRFADIRALAEDFAKRDMKAKDALYVALESLFSFVLDFETEADRKEFVLDNGGKWGKVATENPFQPFVKLAFCGDGISDASRSQYATVLDYARFYRDKSMSLSEWLAQPGGLEARYRDAASGALSKDRYVDPAKLSHAKRNVAATRRSDTFHLDDLPIEIDDAEGGFVIALLQIAPNGAAHVVEYTERDQGKIDSIIAGIAQAQARADTVKAQPLHQLHRALQILSALVPAGKSETDTVFVLSRSASDAEGRTILRAMSTIYTGLRGEVEIADSCKWLPSGTIAVFTHATAKAFHRGFDVEGRWTPSLENALVHFEHDNGTVPQVAVPTSLPKGTYYAARADFHQAAPMVLKLDGARSFLAARKGKTLPAGAYKGSLFLRWADGHLSYYPIPKLPLRQQMFAIHRDPALPDNRLFPADALIALCSIVDILGHDLNAWLTSSPEEDNCAITVQDVIEKNSLRVVLPLATSVRGELTQTNMAS